MDARRLPSYKGDVKWTRGIVFGCVALVALVAVLIVVALGLAPNSSRTVLDVPTVGPRSCKDLIDEYLNKSRSNPDSIWIGIDGLGTSGFIECP